MRVRASLKSDTKTSTPQRMSSISSELSGGAGFTYEASVAAYYLAALVGEQTAPALGNRVVCRVALQQKVNGEPPLFAKQALSVLNANKGVGWTGTTLPRRLAALVQVFSVKGPETMLVKQDLLRVLDYLVDLGDRRSAALQLSPAFRDVRL